MEEAKAGTKSTPETVDSSLSSKQWSGRGKQWERLREGRTTRAQDRLDRQGPGTGAPLRKKFLNLNRLSEVTVS